MKCVIYVFTSLVLMLTSAANIIEVAYQRSNIEPRVALVVRVFMLFLTLMT